jgi:uncharacterized protein
MPDDFLVFFAVGFLGQLVDGALGMAFGLVSTSAMLTMGVSPAHASAMVHTAEIFTTGASALSHIAHKNVNRRLVIELSVAGSLGAFAGALLVSNINSHLARPIVASYLLVLGVLILLRAFRGHQETDAPPRFVRPLGVFGGFLDAVGGGGWGATVTSTLIGSGHAPRHVIGSVNAAEFFVTTAAATTFFVELGLVSVPALVALASGGVLAAPFGAYLARHAPIRPMMVLVGLLVSTLALLQLAKSF